LSLLGQTSKCAYNRFLVVPLAFRFPMGRPLHLARSRRNRDPTCLPKNGAQSALVEPHLNPCRFANPSIFGFSMARWRFRGSKRRWHRNSVAMPICGSDPYQILRRIRPCSSGGASRVVPRMKRFELRVVFLCPATHATAQVRKRRNVFLSVIPSRFGSRVFS
jgi:hypothetical protein